MVPVVTHPERNGLLRQRIAEIAEWVDHGARIQITAQSLLGVFGTKAREFSKTLLDQGLVHFIASDAHDCERRPPRLDSAYAWMEKEYGASAAETLFVMNPQAALNGDPVEAVRPEVDHEPRKWYQIWR